MKYKQIICCLMICYLISKYLAISIIILTAKMDKEQHKHKGECKHDQGKHKGKNDHHKGQSKHQHGQEYGHEHKKIDFLQTSISLRKSIHQYPEVGFEEFQTRDKIIKTLLLFGVKADQMTKLEPTALVVNLQGRAAPSGKPKCVAFRADMDALTMTENNPELEYRSQVKGKAHMCGMVPFNIYPNIIKK